MDNGSKDLIDMLRVTYGDNCISIFNKHGFVWEDEVKGKSKIRHGNILTDNDTLLNMGDLGYAVPIFNNIIEFTLSYTDKIKGYMLFALGDIESTLNIQLNEFKILKAFMISKDDEIKEVKVRARPYAKMNPSLLFRLIDGLYASEFSNGELLCFKRISKVKSKEAK